MLLRMLRPFLQAHWSHLCILSYEVPREVLQPLVPRGLTLDTRDGKCFASLVAFDFVDTKFRGIAWPFCKDFPEVNLRYYVRHGEKRGVCFLSEFVPSRPVAWIARHWYNEPYQRLRMQSNTHRTAHGMEVKHKFWFDGKAQAIEVSAGRDAPLAPSADSWEHFFKEHEWGFTVDHSGVTRCYRVVHPIWQCYRVEWANAAVDWTRVYGPAWKILKGAKPFNALLAEGSAIGVYPAMPIR